MTIITKPQAIAELRRERQQRVKTYHLLELNKKLTAKEKATRNKRLQAAIDLLEDNKPKIKVPSKEILTELNRELRMRKKFYPFWIRKKEHPLNRDAANRRYLRLEAAIQFVKKAKGLDAEQGTLNL